MEELITIKNKINKNLLYLKEKYKIHRLGIFGSYSKGQNTQGSDIDILVSFTEESKIDFFDFLDLKDDLKKILDNEIDLVEEKGLKPRIGKRILREVIYF